MPSLRSQSREAQLAVPWSPPSHPNLHLNPDIRAMQGKRKQGEEEQSRDEYFYPDVFPEDIMPCVLDSPFCQYDRYAGGDDSGDSMHGGISASGPSLRLPFIDVTRGEIQGEYVIAPESEVWQHVGKCSMAALGNRTGYTWSESLLEYLRKGMMSSVTVQASTPL